MKLSDAGELSLLEIIRKKFRKKPRGLILGIGDDCAVVRPEDRNMLLTTDMMVEGVHFDLGWTTPYQLGFKLVSVNVSDIYAMGGTPSLLLLNFAAPKDTDMDFFRGFFEGVRAALKRYNAALAGGDISSSDKITVSATVTGYADKVVFRSGARVGDLIYVSGTLGDSACGLRIMERETKKKGAKGGLAGRSAAALGLINKHLMPKAVRPDRFVNHANAMIDISDGLFIDLSRICRESGVGATIYADRIPLSSGLVNMSAYLETDPLEFALGGGEDYELLFTASPGEKIRACCIGEITRSSMKLVDSAGRSKKVRVKGYEHFGS
jgi:thiamine-monophosphate kinase